MRGFLARRSRKKSSVRKVPKFPSMFNTASFEAELRTDLKEKVPNSKTNVSQVFPTIFHNEVPEESRMYGHTGHGVFIGHEQKGLQILKPGLTIQPGAVA